MQRAQTQKLGPKDEMLRICCAPLALREEREYYTHTHITYTISGVTTLTIEGYAATSQNHTHETPRTDDAYASCDATCAARGGAFQRIGRRRHRLNLLRDFSPDSTAFARARALATRLSN